MHRLVPRALVALILSLAAPLARPVAGAEEGSLPLPTGTLSWGVDEAKGGSEIWLRRQGADAPVALPEPAGRIAARRAEPLPFVAAGELTGLAWLEGDDRQRYAVRFALWRGDHWGTVESVAAPGPGSQLALAGTTLADGRPMLVWAAFDGEDDEILYSVRSAEGSWSAPARVDQDDAFPDITPAIVAADEGALVAWSGFDGDQYRVYVARFDGERFRPARAVGPAGSVFPTFEAAAGPPLLVFRNARPRGWSVAELDRSGAPRRTAFVAGDEREAPSVERRDGALRLRWATSEKDARWQ